MKYYAVAKQETGVNVIIDNLSDNRVEAVNQAKTHCLKNKLTLQAVYPVKNKQRQISVLTKTVKHKKGRRLKFY